ncbi:MAG: late competence development ComFB family protein [Spirochaetales bacterium]|nr:late competence development ComFB family protein [Spirochaetales bacterium]
MRIHNLLEEIVLDKIDEILREYGDRHPEGEIALAEEFRLDVACYVLNRIDPLYMVSGRGLAYLDIDYLEKLQRDADLFTLVHQGIQRILTVKRPHYDEKRKYAEPKDGYYFNFPIIKGRIFNSINFAPVYNIDVLIRHNGKKVEMIEPNWQNPYSIVENTAGNFYFWPKPIRGKKEGEKTTFELEVVVANGEYEELKHFFDVSLVCESGVQDYFKINHILNVKDIYLVPKEEKL